ncbi:MAG: O-antigen ligase family protein [Pseudomonadota bacterium]|nr:O-antigen ligase family protein [Pseudomonadota bacterium]
MKDVESRRSDSGHALPVVLRTPLADETGSWWEASGSGPHLFAFGLLLAGIALVTANGLRIAGMVALGDIPFMLSGALILAVLVYCADYWRCIPSWFYLSGALLLISGLLSTVVASDSMESGISFAKYFYAAYLLPLLIGFVVDRPAWLYRALSVWVAFASLNSLSGLLDLLGVTRFHQWMDVQTSFSYLSYPDRAFGLTTYPNHYGLICAMALPVSLALAALASGWRRVVYALSFLSLAGGILASGSRAMLLASLVVAAILVLWSKTLGRIYLGMGILTGAAFGMLFVLEPSMVSKVAMSWHRLTGSVSIGQSDILRVEIFKRSFHEIAGSPVLGNGFSSVRDAHNIFVQVLQAGGLVALAGMCLYVIGYISTVMSLARGLVDERWSMIAKAIAASVFVWLVSGLVQNAIYDRYIYLPIGFTFSLLVIVHRYRILLPVPGLDEAGVLQARLR